MPERGIVPVFHRSTSALSFYTERNCVFKGIITIQMYTPIYYKPIAYLCEKDKRLINNDERNAKAQNILRAAAKTGENATVAMLSIAFVRK